MRPLRLLLPSLFLSIAVFGVTAADATIVTGITGVHRNGQTFLTWNVPSAGGWTYRIYLSPKPLRRTSDMRYAALVGTVGDSTWMDRRVSALLGQTYAFSRDSAGPPLPESSGLFVNTAGEFGFQWYVVTAQQAGGAEDQTVIAGVNALGSPVLEQPAPPRPVWQRQLPSEYGGLAEDFVLWTSNRDTPFAKAMSSQNGWPFHCALVRGAAPPNNRLFLRGHGRGGNFLQATWGYEPSDWRLSVDDYLPNKDVASFYYGYHEKYVLNSSTNPTPQSGRIRGYTYARIIKFLDWALASFPIDPNRIYAMGHSMGGSFGVFLALTAGDRVAAVWANVPKLDLSDFRGSWLYEAMFTPMWGDTVTDLPTDEGIPIYVRMRASSLAAHLGAREVAPILSFAGRSDSTVGWPEKVNFYAAMEENRLGGVHFWDQRGHGGAGGMDPMGGLEELFRYRLDRSWPAFSNASCNSYPGTGEAATGDSIGSINGYLDWDTTLVDFDDRWEVMLHTRDIETRWGTLPAPGMLTVDVTPRRLQHFHPVPGQVLEWSVKRMSDAVVAQQGSAVVDAYGHVTAEGVTVYGSGSYLQIKMLGPADVGTPLRPRPLLALDRAPVVGRTTLTATWPGTGDASLALFDLSGRRLRTLHQGPARGAMRFDLDGGGLGAGVYFLRARQDGRSATLRFALLH